MKISVTHTAFGYVLSGFGRPFGLNTDSQNNLYITDMDYHTVIKVNPSLKRFYFLNVDLQCWQTIEHFKLNTKLNGPHSIEFDFNDNFYVTTYYVPLVHRYAYEGKELKKIGSKSSAYPLKGPASAFFVGASLCVSEYAKNELVFYEGDEFHRSITGLDRPHMAKMGPDGFLYCADTWNHCVKKINVRDQVSHQWSVKSGIKPFTPVAINFYKEIILCTDWANHQILLFDLFGNWLKSFDGLNLKHPYDAMAWKGKLVIADSHNHRVLIINDEEL